jgi:hypothetical protein
MLRSHRILCSCVPAPFFVFLCRATLSHFHLHDRLLPPFRCFPHARLHSRIPAQFPARPRPLALFRCFAHARLHARIPAQFPTRPRPLAVSRTLMPARICTAQHAAMLAVSCTPVRRRSLFPHARSRTVRSPFPAHPFAALHARLPPRASSSASPRQQSRARR